MKTKQKNRFFKEEFLVVELKTNGPFLEVIYVANPTDLVVFGNIYSVNRSKVRWI